MEIFTEIRPEFQARYHSMLTAVKSKINNVTICTVHDTVPNIEESEITAVSLFNEVILNEVFSHKNKYNPGYIDRNYSLYL